MLFYFKTVSEIEKIWFCRSNPYDKLIIQALKPTTDREKSPPKLYLYTTKHQCKALIFKNQTISDLLFVSTETIIFVRNNKVFLISEVSQWINNQSNFQHEVDLNCYADFFYQNPFYPNQLFIVDGFKVWVVKLNGILKHSSIQCQKSNSLRFWKLIVALESFLIYILFRPLFFLFGSSISISLSFH